MNGPWRKGITKKIARGTPKYPAAQSSCFKGVFFRFNLVCSVILWTVLWVDTLKPIAPGWSIHSDLSVPITCCDFYSSAKYVLCKIFEQERNNGHRPRLHFTRCESHHSSIYALTWHVMVNVLVKNDHASEGKAKEKRNETWMSSWRQIRKKARPYCQVPLALHWFSLGAENMNVRNCFYSLMQLQIHDCNFKVIFSTLCSSGILVLLIVNVKLNFWAFFFPCVGINM